MPHIYINGAMNRLRGLVTLIDGQTIYMIPGDSEGKEMIANLRNVGCVVLEVLRWNSWLSSLFGTGESGYLRGDCRGRKLTAVFNSAGKTTLRGLETNLMSVKCMDRAFCRTVRIRVAT